MSDEDIVLNPSGARVVSPLVLRDAFHLDTRVDMSLLRRLIFLAPALALVLAACGDDSQPPSDEVRFSVVITSPDPNAVLFPGDAVTFSAELSEPADDVDAGTIVWDWTLGDGAVISGQGPTISYTYQTAGEFNATVTASETVDGEVIARERADIAVVIVPSPDLALGEPTVSLTTTTLTSADRFRVSVDMINGGAEAPIPFSVGVYIAPADGIDAASPPDAESLATLVDAGGAWRVDAADFESLGAGASANVDRSEIGVPAEAPSGEYVVFVFADDTDVLGEDDEANNIAFGDRGFSFINTSADGADLAARDLSPRPTRTNRIDTITLDAQVFNAGNQQALLFEYDVWLSFGDRDLDDSDILLGGDTLDGAGPGEQVLLDDVIFAVEPPAIELGEYYVLLRVDSGDAIDEVDEENNVAASPPILVTDEPPPGVDIVIDSFEIAPNNTFLGGSVEVTARLRNQGAEEVESQFFCRIHLSDDETFESSTDPVLDTVQVQPMDAGETVDVTRVARIRTNIAPGEYFGFLSCDPSFVVPESDEENNIRRTTETIDIAGDAVIDVNIGAFSVTPDTVDNGDQVAVSVEVCNSGSNGSTPSIVRVHLSTDDVLDSFDPILIQSNVPPIDPDGCITIATEAPAICETFLSQYRVFAVADATDTVPESDEDNNVAELDTRLTIEGILCACTPDRFEPNNSLSNAEYLNPSVGSYSDLTMCEVATDWYIIPLLRGETIQVVLTFDNDRGNLDATLYGTDRSSVLSTSASDGDREEVSYFVAPQSGDYYLRVAGRTPDDRNVYDLALSVSSRSSGTDLIVLNTEVTPTDPVLGDTVQLDFDLVNLGDVPAGPSLARFYLSDDADIDPIEDLRLDELEIDEVVDRLSQRVDLVLPDDIGGGEAYIGVIADARGEVGELDEDNNIGVTPRFDIDGACYDALEPNNQLDAARLIELTTEPPVTFGGLLVCSDNRDVYEVCVDDGAYLDVTVDFDNTLGDVDVRLYDEMGDEVDRSEDTGSQERVGIDYASGERCFRVEIYVVNRDREVPYTLTVDTGAAPDELACSRIEEPNDSFGAALQLRDFLDDDLAICPVEDADYYRIALTPGADVTFRLVPAEGEDAVPSQLRMALFSPSRNFITNTVSALEPIEHRVALNGTHYLRVNSNGAGPRNQRYRVEVDGISGTDLVPSNLVLEPGIAGPGDEVRFTFDVANTRDADAPASHYAVWLSTDPALDDDDVLLREVDLPSVPGLGTLPEGRRFTVPGDIVDGGTFYVLLEVDSDDEVAEFVERNNIALATLIITPRCTPDIGEPNNFSFEAFDAGDVPDDATLSICSGDADWYTWRASVTGSVDVTIEFEHADGDLDLFVFSEELGDPIAAGDSVFDNETATFTAIGGRTYYILVDSFYDDTNTYTLTID